MKKMEKMRALFVAVIAIAILTASASGIYASGKYDGLTWKTSKKNGKYVTKFYASGELTATVKTKKKLPVKVMKSEKISYKKLMKRCNKYILVEQVEGTCLNSYGDGKDQQGYYISYRKIKGHKAGDVYRSYFVYANNRYEDDVIGRCDYLIDTGQNTKHEIVCPNCDGTSKDCVYWYIDTNGIGKHMTAQEIEEFELMEMDR